MLNPACVFHQSKSLVLAGGFGIRQACFDLDKSRVRTPKSKQFPWQCPECATALFPCSGACQCPNTLDIRARRTKHGAWQEDRLCKHDHRLQQHASGSATLFSDPLPDVLHTPDGHVHRQLDGFREGPRLHAPPQCGLGDGNKLQNLCLSKKANLRQGWHRNSVVRCRSQCNGAPVWFGHDLASSRRMPMEDMTCSVAAALGQGLRMPIGTHDSGITSAASRSHGVVVSNSKYIGPRQRAGSAQRGQAQAGRYRLRRWRNMRPDVTLADDMGRLKQERLVLLEIVREVGPLRVALASINQVALSSYLTTTAASTGSIVSVPDETLASSPVASSS
jgi:hypothetical protein